MQTLPSFKRGDTFAFTASIKDSSGTPIIGAISKLKCQIRNNLDVLMGETTITEPTSGNYMFKIANTEFWPTGITLYLDIQYTDNDVITSSETISVQIEKDVTHNG